jgi:hypothetical protein
MYYIKGHGWVRILSSARKHGVADEDICHAIGQAVVVMVMESGPRGRTLFVGADSPGRPLEVVTVTESDGTLSAIHAMPMRRKFERYLTQGDTT